MRLLQHMNSIINTRLTDMAEVHRAVMEAMVGLFAVGEEDNFLSQLELMIMTANGEWLEVWGSFFSVIRKTGESDPKMRKRIIDSIKSPKATIPAMKDWIVNWLNAFYNPQPKWAPNDIEIREGWRGILVYSHKNFGENFHPTYSTSFRYTGTRYARCIIQITIPENLTPELRELVLAVKAAGIQVWYLRRLSYGVIDDYSKVPLYRFYHIHAWLKKVYNDDPVLIYDQWYKGKYDSNRVYSGGKKIWGTVRIRQFSGWMPQRFTTWQSPLFKADMLSAWFNQQQAVVREIEDYVVKVNTDVEVTQKPHQPA